MSHFRLLADPDSYIVSDEDLLTDHEARNRWLDQFERHFEMTLATARVEYGGGARARTAAAAKQFTEMIAAIRAEPTSAGQRLGVLELCQIREKALRDNGLHDPFRHVKQRENAAALELYPEVLCWTAGLTGQERWLQLIRGVFAGNIFDVGSPVTEGYAREQVDFEATVEDVRPRPWRIDDFDALATELPEPARAARWAKAVVFVDNAGADLLLGVMPLVRQLASCGVEIVLAANELPSLNDITADETVYLLEQLAAIDDELGGYVRAGLFEIVSTGNGLPLIDLGQVSDELNAAAEGADLVVLEGMGRTVESNFNTPFTVDCIQLCLLKDPFVAARIGGEVFDCVCSYRPAGAG